MTEQRPNQDAPASHPEDKTLMRSLGEFFGHIWKGVTSDPAPTARRERTEEEHRDTPMGPVTIRRTIIEEVRLPAPPDRESPSGGEPPGR